MTDTNTSEKQEFMDDLAAIAAGEEAVIDRHLDLLTEDDEMRDLRHEAKAIADDIAALGADYEHPADFEAELLSTIDAQSAPAKNDGNDLAKQRSKKKPQRLRSFFYAVSAVAAAALLMVVGAQLGSSDSHDHDVAVSASIAPLTAKLIQTQRSANDGILGVTVGSQSVRVGTEIVAGSTIRTDSRTRIVLQLSDTSTITVAPNSELHLDKSAQRTLSLVNGELVADVAHNEQGPNANFLLPAGRVEVLGTKFVLSADSEQSSVRVLRGRVAFHGDAKSVHVSAGEEGSIVGSGAPEVSPALYLADSIRWSELGPEQGEDRSGSGLGELRAYKPGQSRDRDWPMALQDHKVTVRLVGNVARTEIEETFRNDSKTVLEGVYKFPLPAGAQIDKLSLDVDGRFEEGAIVDKERATKIWSGVIAKATVKRRRRPMEMIWVPGPWRDPAILEWQQGNRFELRIFPIPAEGTRTIKLAYTQTIAPHGKRRRYVYPLPSSADGSSVAEHFDIDMQLTGIAPDSMLRNPGYEMETARDRGTARLHLAADAFVPNGDLVVEYQPKNASSELRAWGFQGAAATPPGLDKGKGKKQSPKAEVLAEQARLSSDARGYALLALRPTLPRWTEHTRHDYVLVLDSSQSMVGERFERASSTAAALIAEMDMRDRVMVLACDLECKRFGDEPMRPSATRAREVKAWLETIEPAGASYLEHALEEGAKSSDSFDDAKDRERLVVYIGDGVASMGHRTLSVLSQSARTLRKTYDTNFTTVAIGADADSRILGTIARAGGGYFIGHRSGRRASHLAQAVLETTMGVSLRDAEIVLPPGMSDGSQGTLSTLRAGDEFLLTARYDRRIEGDVLLRGTVGGKPYENRFSLDLPLTNHAANGFVPKIWATQAIERLETEGRAGSRDTIVALSKSYGVMSKQTSLLVLESEAMFKAFGVDRAKPLVQWTGEEGEAQSSGSDGDEDYGNLLGESAEDGAGAEMAGERMTRSAPAKRRQARPSVVGGMDFSGGGRGGRWMRRVWYREASIARFEGTGQSIRDAIDDAERNLAANPDSRDRHRSLVEALSYAGDLGRAEEVAEQWLSRDKLDPEVLAYLADIAARQGRRDDSIRLLSGVVDLRPDDKALHLRLAKAYQRSGELGRACAHRVVLAELDDDKTGVLANAIRCENDNGRKPQADAILDATPVSLRGRALHAAGQPQSRERVTGDLVLDASWTGGSDLDIAIITPKGRRISWQGGHRRVVAADVTRIGSERLGLRRIRKGNYLIEVTRTSPEKTTPIHGQLNIRVLGRKQRIAFDLRGEAKVVGRVAVRMRSRLE